MVTVQFLMIGTKITYQTHIWKVWNSHYFHNINEILMVQNILGSESFPSALNSKVFIDIIRQRKISTIFGVSLEDEFHF